MDDRSIRRMHAADLPAAHALARVVGWSHRLADWEFHFSLGYGYVACDPAGTVVGTGMCWSWGPDVGSLGLIVVDPAEQGRGIGVRLMQSLIEAVDRPSLRLVATVAGLRLYRRFGFSESGGIEQRQGTPARDLPAAVATGTTLRRSTRSDLPDLIRLDAAAFGAQRDRLVEAILAVGQGMVALSGGAPVGFALSRASSKGTLIGPVVAPDEVTAIALARSLIPLDGSIARLDIPAGATGLAEWLEAAGLPRVDVVTPMLRGTVHPPSAVAHTFALASQAFG